LAWWLAIFLPEADLLVNLFGGVQITHFGFESEPGQSALFSFSDLSVHIAQNGQGAIKIGHLPKGA